LQQLLYVSGLNNFTIVFVIVVLTHIVGSCKPMKNKAS